MGKGTHCNKAHGNLKTSGTMGRADTFTLQPMPPGEEEEEEECW